MQDPLQCKQFAGSSQDAARVPGPSVALRFTPVFSLSLKNFPHKHTCSVENCGKWGKPAFPLIPKVETIVELRKSSTFRKFAQFVPHLRFCYYYLYLYAFDLGFYAFIRYEYLFCQRFDGAPTWGFLNTIICDFDLSSAFSLVRAHRQRFQQSNRFFNFFLSFSFSFFPFF